MVRKHRKRKQMRRWTGVAGIYFSSPVYIAKFKSYSSAINKIASIYDLDPHRTAQFRKDGYLDMNIDGRGMIDYIGVF